MQQGSNLRPTEPQSAVLPTELCTPYIKTIGYTVLPATEPRKAREGFEPSCSQCDGFLIVSIGHPSYLQATRTRLVGRVALDGWPGIRTPID